MFNIEWPSGFQYIFIIIDILAVSYIVYKIIIYMFNTKALNIFKGIILIALVFVIATAFNMKTLLWFFEKGVDILPLAVLIVFQPEIRKFLVSLGTPKIFLKFNEEYKKIYRENMQKIFSAISQLSQRRIGAIILIEQDMNLDLLKEEAIPLNSEISEQLLISIFIPTSPLHDGAVLIKSGKVMAARVFLPITEEKIAPYLGSRHRAAIGVTEHNDCIALVVSEETGYVSLANKGKIFYNIGIEKLEEKVFQLLGIQNVVK